MRPIYLKVALLVLTLCVISCEPEVESITWEPIPAYETLNAIRFPTGGLTTLPDYNYETVIEKELAGVVNTYVVLADLLAKIAEASEEPPPLDTDTGSDSDGYIFDTASLPDEQADTDYAPQTSKNGTHAFLRFSCPGPSRSNPDTTFSSGEVRMDSGDLSDEFILISFWYGADLYFRFMECETPNGVLNANAAAYLFGVPTLAMFVDLRGFGLQEGGVSITDMYLTLQGFSLLMNVEGEGTYRIDAYLAGSLLRMSIVGQSYESLSCLAENYGTSFIGCNVVD